MARNGGLAYLPRRDYPKVDGLALTSMACATMLGEMEELDLNIQNALRSFYDDPALLEKLGAMAVSIAEDDQRYVPEQLLRLLDRNDQDVELKRRIVEFFNGGSTLDDTAKFILANKEVRPVALEQCAPVFQDFFLKLSERAKEQSSLCKAVMFYGVAMALYEWKDRRRGGVPYDDELHGPIIFSTPSRKKL